MRLAVMQASEITFVYECISELRGSVSYTEDDFRAYVRSRSLGADGECTIFVAHEDGEPVGMLTCNRFAMPRFLGDGVELEEVAIHPRHQGRGLSKSMLEAFCAMAEGWPSVRKIIVKTDDARLGSKVYGVLFEPTRFIVYSRPNHLL